jgi:hypothetical protein
MMRGVELRIEQQRTENAILALMIRRAMNEKKISLDDLLGRKRDDRKQRPNKVVSIEEKRRTLEELERALG